MFQTWIWDGVLSETQWPMANRQAYKRQVGQDSDDSKALTQVLFAIAAIEHEH